MNPATLTCQTGGCFAANNDGTQLMDCSVSNGGGSPTSPVTQIEITSTASSMNYDVSLVAGYNVETRVAPRGGSWVPPWTSPPTQETCLTMGCATDLNAICPSTLRYTGSGTTVIGCMDPCDQCNVGGKQIFCDTPRSEQWVGCTPTPSVIPPPTPTGAGTATPTPTPTPTPTATPGASGSPVPTTTPTPTVSPVPTSGAVTYGDLYCAKNLADGNAMASANQGTPTAFGQADCLPGTTFVQPSFASSYALPAGIGVCLSVNSGLAPHFNDFSWANTAGSVSSCGGLPTTDPPYQPLPDGTACGGYVGAAADYDAALGYTCQTATYTDTTGASQVAHLCLPPTAEGLGQCTLDADAGGVPLYSSAAGVTNPSWLDAAMVAASGTIPGTGTPFYETFKAACPRAYAWQYDDASAGVACTTTQGPAFLGVQTLFCASQMQSESADDSSPPPQIVRLHLRGAAVKIGSTTELGAARVRGQFTPERPVALDQIRVRLTDLLDEPGAAGELVRAPDGARGLPVLKVLGAAHPRRVVYATGPGVVPRIQVELSRPRDRHPWRGVGTTGAAGAVTNASPVEVRIFVDDASIAAPERCALAARGARTWINTGLRIETSPGDRPILAATTVPWVCGPAGVLRPVR